MNCYVCGAPGRAFRLWKSLTGKELGTRHVCTNKACTFEYESVFDGKKTARPTWGELKAKSKS